MTKTGINVLSLFDGISCGQIALQRCGIKVNNYFSSEIETNSIQATQSNYPDTIQLGNIKNVKLSELSKIDLILAGSPCQGFSSENKNANSSTIGNFQHEESKLFFEFLRLLNDGYSKYKNVWFLLENVAMKSDHSFKMSSFLKLKYYKICSSLVSAQTRSRLYWTNIPNIKKIKDKQINLIDILETPDDGIIYPGYITNRITKAPSHPELFENASKRNIRVRKNKLKAHCIVGTNQSVLTSVSKCGYYDYKKFSWKKYSLAELCRLQTLPEDYFFINELGNYYFSKSSIQKMIGNGWTVDVIVELLKPLKKLIDNNSKQYQNYFWF